MIIIEPEGAKQPNTSAQAAYEAAIEFMRSMDHTRPSPDLVAGGSPAMARRIFRTWRSPIHRAMKTKI